MFASGKMFFVQNTTSSYSFLLDNLSVSAEVAYSLRKLRSAYSGSAINVRRSSDNATQDIGFSNNVLDETALLSFVNNVSAGNGWIVTWYDQGPASPSATNLVQTTATLQPQIVKAGEVIKKNGKPIVEFYNNYLGDAATTRLTAYPYTVSMVACTSAGGGGYGPFFHNGAGNNGLSIGITRDTGSMLMNNTVTPQNCRFYVLKDGKAWLYSDALAGSYPAEFVSPSAALHTFTVTQLAGTVPTSAYIDNVRINTNAGGAVAPNTPTAGIYIGRWVYNNSNFVGSEAEMIVWKNNLDAANRSILQSNQLSFYGSPT